MSMGADDRPVGSANRPVRRPTIRKRAITPPRTSAAAAAAGLSPKGGWMLPPPRTPSVRLPLRPVLQIIEDDVADGVAAGAAPRPPAPGTVVAFWHRRPTLCLAAASLVMVAIWTTLGVVLARGAGGTAVDERAMATSISETTAATIETARTAEPAAPAPVPVVDVNSLPAAPAKPR